MGRHRTESVPPIKSRMHFNELGWKNDFIIELKKQISEGRIVTLSCHPSQDSILLEAINHFDLKCTVAVDSSTKSSEYLPRTRHLRPRAIAVFNAMRPHQWSKNILLFVPLLAAQAFYGSSAWLDGLLAFVAFSAAASAVYVWNDMMDAPSDRTHPIKRKRPFAAGALSLETGLFLWIALATLAGSIALALPQRFGVILLFYFLGNILYTCGLKRVAGLDLVMLAAMYTSRILAGGAATATPVSQWLASFAVFLFFGLGAVKRYVELSQSGEQPTAGRGYQNRDAETVFALGVGSSLMSAVVLALYLSSTQAGLIYGEPSDLWMLMAVHLFWITRIWTAARRGDVSADPVIFVLRDRQSYLAALAAAIALWLAT